MTVLKLPEKPIALDDHGAFPEARHVFDPPMITALNAALHARRALLVRGEPGTGKSQLARAAAALFVPRRAFICFAVDARTEARDLLYTFDAVSRLADAQAKKHAGDLGPGKYLAPGPLWWVIDPKSAAEKQGVTRASPAVDPYLPDKWQPGHGMVLLIDEIDKADASVPNGLLDTLGQQRFPLPGGGRVEHDDASPAPLVIVTTNEDRALPDPFLRRCLVHHLRLPDDDAGLTEVLLERGEAHFPDLGEAVRKKAAALLLRDRRAMEQQKLAPPGCAEYLDLLRAVRGMSKAEAKQRALLDQLARYVLIKHDLGPAHETDG